VHEAPCRSVRRTAGTVIVLPGGVRVIAVRGEPQETRRVVLARRAGPLEGPAARVADALISAARD
jgi:hypothetical protein